MSDIFNNSDCHDVTYFKKQQKRLYLAVLAAGYSHEDIEELIDAFLEVEPFRHHPDGIGAICTIIRDKAWLKEFTKQLLTAKAKLQKTNSVNF